VTDSIDDPDYPVDQRRLPEAWRLVYLGTAVSDIRNGFSSGRHNEEGRGIAHLRPMNISRNGEIVLDHTKYVEIIPPFTAAAGDVLFNNTNSRELVGKTAVLTQPGEWAFSNHITRIRTSAELMPEFLALQMQLLWHTGYFRARARQHVNQASISSGVLSKTVPIIIAPIEDQQRVITALRRSHEALDRIRNSISNAQRSLDRLDDNTLRLAAELKLSAADSVERSTKLVRVADVGDVQLGKMRSPKAHTGPNMRPYLRVANVLEDKLDLEDVHEMNFEESEFERFKLQPGDILLNEGQSPELVGRPAMFRNEIEDCFFQKTLIRFRPKAGVSGTFCLLVFRHYLRSGRFKQVARWSTNLAHLTAVRFSEMEFPLAALEVQEQVVSEASRRLDLAAETRALLTDVDRRCEMAWDLSLREAFYAKQATTRAMPAHDTLNLDRNNEQVTLMPVRGGPRNFKGILDAYKKDDVSLPVTELFDRVGGTHATVDHFYAELRDLVREGKLVETRSQAGEPILTVVESR
jgi:type I restriction enzyme, S subunit